MDRADVTAALRARVQAMEGTRPARSALPTDPVVRALLPAGLLAGSTYLVVGSGTLAAALLGGVGRDGGWCAVAGMPTFGVEAAAALGVDPGRTVWVPDLGGQGWPEVVATLVESVQILLLAPPAVPAPAAIARIDARLRTSGAALVISSPTPLRWPGLEATLTASTTRWHGIDTGRGRLSSRTLDVHVTPRSARPVRVEIAQGPTGGLLLPREQEVTGALAS
ncbi:hypothetical protein [Janibacter massiliensis]|uniref:hypothetical protein n=1 Tax=Janibacter massiliensis TaxID=2058291 RepID=UPI00131A5DEA|nr:hypothetical protein [Janibacter massiliensis]